MNSISPMDIKAKDIMTKSLKSIDLNADLRDAIATLNRERIHHLIVYDGKKYAGIFGYKELGKVYRQPKVGTKVGNIISKPPLLPEDTNIIDIVDHMYRLNYKIMPVGEDKNVSGVVSERDILNAVLKFGLLAGKKVETLMTPNPMTITQTDRLAKAITTLRENNISRLPVVDKDGRAAGILESIDIIKYLTAKENIIKDAGSSPHPKYAGMDSNLMENVLEFDVPLDSLVSPNFVSAKKGDLIVDKIKENVNLDTTSIMVTDEKGCLIGIVAPKDIIQFLALLKEREKVYIQISGLENLSFIDEFQKQEIHQIIERTVKKLANVSDMTNFTIHAKSHDTQGNKAKYSFRCKLMTGKDGLVFAKNWGWDPIDAVAVLMGEVEGIVLEKVRKRSETFRRKSRDTKKHSEFTMG